LPVAQFVARQDLLPINMSETETGSVTTREVQTFSYTLQGAFDAGKFAGARLVGAIADFNEFDSNQFHFYDLVDRLGNVLNGAHLNSQGVPVDGNGIPLSPVVQSATHKFEEGDLPVDGIVMAKVLDTKSINFIPEAALVANPDKTAGGTLFFDYLNNR
jgi:hypothetical protein